MSQPEWIEVDFWFKDFVQLQLILISLKNYNIEYQSKYFFLPFFCEWSIISKRTEEKCVTEQLEWSGV